MSLDDLPILQAGTTLTFREYGSRIAEVKYQDEYDGTVTHLVGYAAGIFPGGGYLNRRGEIFHMENCGENYGKRLLLIREVVIHDNKRGEDIWDDAKREEIPLKLILEYREMKLSKAFKIKGKIIDLEELAHDNANFAHSEREPTSVRPLIKSSKPFFYMWTKKGGMDLLVFEDASKPDTAKLFRYDKKQLYGGVDLEKDVPAVAGKAVVKFLQKYAEGRKRAQS